MDTVYHSSIPCHTIEKQPVEGRNQFTYCSLCRDWFKPVAPKDMPKPNDCCVNCRHALGAHGSISTACPDRDSFYAERATEFKRFAYIPVGDWFRINASGTTEFLKINEDEATTNRDSHEHKYRFKLAEKCAYPIVRAREVEA
jgi:hypothetical protein